MRFTSIPRVEREILSGGQNLYMLQSLDLPIPGEPLRLRAQFCKPIIRSGYFHATEYPKERIVMHFTVGNLLGDLETLTRQDIHDSVAYLIARDGTIYQILPSKYWSGHLGRGVGNTGIGNAEDKKTIAIELSNYGYLAERQGNLETIYSRQVSLETHKVGPVDVYCSLDEEDAYQKIKAPFREQTYFATHTQAQYQSLITLIRYLTATHDIPREFLPLASRFQTTNDVMNFRGIVSHINYRSIGKWDLGPAFDWDQVVAGVQASVYVPMLQRNQGSVHEFGDHTALGDEKDLLPLLPSSRSAAYEDEEYDDVVSSTIVVPKNRKLFALVIGINTYDENILLDDGVRFPTLYGCVGDADKIADYLRDQPDFDTEIVQLTDRDATKENIVRLIRTHLGQAGPDDTALLYFSGHGTQEYADIAWDEETDGKLECLTCYYDAILSTDFLLADKELRYLIHEIYQNKKPHIITLFDCCHSGDNTRALTVSKVAFPHGKAIAKRIPYTFKQRDWSNFVFADELSLNKLKTDKTAKSLPEGVHVSLSACEADESAVEVGGEGVFTKILVNILRNTGGNITYQDLQSRVRAYLRSVYEQQPRFRVAGGSSGLLYRTFLGGSEQRDGELLGIILHDGTGWTLDKGAIQGVSGANKIITAVKEGEKNETINFRVKTILPDYTQLEPENEVLNQSAIYKLRIDGLMSHKLRIAFELEDVSRSDRSALLNEVIQRMKDRLVVVEKLDELPAAATGKVDTNSPLDSTEDNIDYVLRGRKGQYYLTYPILKAHIDDSAAYRPLAKPIESEADNALDELICDLRHIARWEYIRRLENADKTNRLRADPLMIEIWRQNSDGSEEEILIDDSSDAWLNFWQDGDGWVCPLRIKITNQSGVDLYVSALYLSMAFESYLSLLPDEVFSLEKGKSIELNYNDEAYIGFRMSDVTSLYNWPERVEYLKFVVSTVLFSPQEMSLEPLPAPSTLDKDASASRGKRGPGQIHPLPKPKSWVTQRINLHWQNSKYNQLEYSTIRKMLDDEELLNFALGLYFENKDDTKLGNIQLKAVLRDLRADEYHHEKGLAGDIVLNIANRIARSRRNRRFNKAVEQNPNLFRIVSEGDSWFQHPLVTDTIDHLTAYYPVYCLAAAGDTLRNITLASGTPPVEEYVAAVTAQKPALLLLSGGGNDILGEQFRRYIKEGVSEAVDPASYLEELLTKDLDSLQAMYRSIFQKMKSAHPNLKILVHGYDYITPLSVTDKGWLGRYMIEKGIKSAIIRKAILKHILVEFNTRLKEVVEDFPDTVSYIATLGTVADDEWYDEIHPNGVGFGKVAEKFKLRIDELMRV